MKELARARIKDGKITIPPNIMEKLLLQEYDKVSFYTDHRGRMILRKYRGEDGGASGERKKQEARESANFRVEYKPTGQNQPFPFNPEMFKDALKDIFENEEAQEMMKKTAEDLSKNFGKVFGGMFENIGKETINLDDLDYDQEPKGEETDSKMKKKEAEKKKKKDDDEEEFRIKID
ncbi:MAG: hypothetical protein ACXAEU_06915 [Candidatus Hodarchaeales archaeon]|jgi:bifunctional DNA-binding transcriptional regulator/antitoxin component of YhaV-PrlF toxin-antitoxin module